MKSGDLESGGLVDARSHPKATFPAPGFTSTSTCAFPSLINRVPWPLLCHGMAKWNSRELNDTWRSQTASGMQK